MHGSPCPYCTRIMNVHSDKLKPTREHIKPRSRFRRSQLLIVCHECNAYKGNRTLNEFVSFLSCRNVELERALLINNLRLKTLEKLTEELKEIP